MLQLCENLWDKERKKVRKKESQQAIPLMKYNVDAVFVGSCFNLSYDCVFSILSGVR